MTTLYPPDQTPPIHIKSARELELEYAMRTALPYLIGMQVTQPSDKLERIIEVFAREAE